MDILLAVLTSLGTCVVLCSGVLMLLSPVMGRKMVTVWHLRDDCEDLEFRVRCCVFLQKCGLFTWKLLLVDCGLNPHDRRRAELLAREQPMVDLVSECDLHTYFDMVR